MRRRPNPWIVVPAVALGLLAGALGWVVTEVSCSQPDPNGMTGTCPGWAGFFAVLSFLFVTVGVTILLALVFRSLAEWREREGRGA